MPIAKTNYGICKQLCKNSILIKHKGVLNEIQLREYRPMLQWKEFCFKSEKAMQPWAILLLVKSTQHEKLTGTETTFHHAESNRDKLKFIRLVRLHIPHF